MRRGRAVLAACAALAVAPAAAAAADLVTVFGGGPSTPEMTAPVRITGLLSVQFHGDPAAGCPRWGLCGYSGTVSWQPPTRATLEIDRTGGRHPQQAIALLPDFAGAEQSGQGVTTASVHLAASPGAPAAQCVDAAGSSFLAFRPVRKGRVALSLGDVSSGLLMTRCAGPRDADVLPDLPTPTIDVATLRRGHTTISLVGSTPFRSHGFSGTITSTVAMHVGRPGQARAQRNTGSRRRTSRARELIVSYRATLSGTVVEDVRGAPDPLECRELGSCGLAGTITATPHVQTTQATLFIEAPATTPPRELLAAAGMGRGSPGAVAGSGSVAWRGGGSVVSDLDQGPEHCVDRAPLGAGGVLILTHGGHWQAMMPAATLGSPITLTRCPGPSLATASIVSRVAPASALHGRTTRVSLATGSIIHDDGYTVRIVPHLTLTLTRVKVTTRVFRLAPGEIAGF